MENKGIERYLTVGWDSLNQTPLNNNNPYYFSLSTFVYNENSKPKFMESEGDIIEVFPESIPSNVDLEGAERNTKLSPKLLGGLSSAEINFNIVDPLALTGDTYRLTFTQFGLDTTYYTLTNTSTGVILLEDMDDIMYETENEFGEKYIANSTGKIIIDGFTLNIRDRGYELINRQRSKYGVVDVVEVAGPGGEILDFPLSVNNKKINSTYEWSVFPQGAIDRYNWQGKRNHEGLGHDYYEIRFTSTGSDYFVTGYQLGTLRSVAIRDDQKGIGKVPFEIWNIKQTLDDTSDDERLIVKILDHNNFQPDSALNDNKWSRLPSGNWEEIYAYQDSTMDADNLPQQSGESKFTSHKFGAFVISGSVPQEGTVIRILPAIPLNENDVFEITMPKPELNSSEHVKKNLDKINVFPNPYYGTHGLELSRAGRFVRFINLPRKATIRIFNLGGTYIQKIVKESESDFIDWNLQNLHNLPVASGIYIAYIDLDGIGTKVLKIAVIREE